MARCSRFWYPAPILTGCALLAAAPPHRATAEGRAASPGDAVVFVRVIGTLITDDNLGWRRSDLREGVELGTGSGFSVTSRGHVLTNLHVVRDQSFQFDRAGTTYSVTLERRRIEIASPGSGSRESRSYAARVVATDEALDLALLEVDGPPVPYLALRGLRIRRHGGRCEGARLPLWQARRRGTGRGHPASFRGSASRPDPSLRGVPTKKTALAISRPTRSSISAVAAAR